MEKKYYDLIISLIKNHRKYAGLESILDDIANDVLEHSKVVLSTVSNEDVVRAYLEKTVGTSIITVPKKMNMSTRSRHRIVESIAVETNVVDVQDDVILNESDFVNIQKENIVNEEEIFVEEKVEEESNLLDEVTEDLENTDNLELIENQVEEMVVINNQEECAVVLEEILDEVDSEELLVHNDNEVIEDEIEEVEAIEKVNLVEDVDKALVDKMINGVSVEDSLEEEVEESVLSEEVNEVYETLEDVEFIEETLDEPIELTEKPLESESDEEIINLSIVESEDAAEFAFDLDEASEDVLLDVTIDNVEQEQTEPNDNGFQPPNYECFSFEPEKRDFDLEEVFSELSEINKKHPERKIIEICELKYTKKLSVSEIAKSVNFSEEQVLDVLNEVIEIVKD